MNWWMKMVNRWMANYNMYMFHISINQFYAKWVNTCFFRWMHEGILMNEWKNFVPCRFLRKRLFESISRFIDEEKNGADEWMNTFEVF